MLKRLKKGKVSASSIIQLGIIAFIIYYNFQSFHMMTLPVEKTEIQAMCQDISVSTKEEEYYLTDKLQVFLFKEFIGNMGTCMKLNVFQKVYWKLRPTKESDYVWISAGKDGNETIEIIITEKKSIIHFLEEDKYWYILGKSRTVELKKFYNSIKNDTVEEYYNSLPKRG